MTNRKNVPFNFRCFSDVLLFLFELIVLSELSRLSAMMPPASEMTIEFFTIGLSDAFLSDYLTVLKLHIAK